MADQPTPLSVESGNPAAVCAECGNTFNEGDMIRHGNVFICANCKPIFMQKLAEGAKIDVREMYYAGFWVRFVARFLDGIFVVVLIMICAFIFGLLAVSLGPSALQSGIIPIGIAIIEIGCLIVYEVLFVGKWGATPGKMILKLKIVTPEGGPISYLRALARFLCYFIDNLTFLIGYIIAAFDPEKRALHDRICNTRVIYTNK